MSNPLRPRRFDLIAFDWDGTLYDSTAIIVGESDLPMNKPLT